MSKNGNKIDLGSPGCHSPDARTSLPRRRPDRIRLSHRRKYGKHECPPYLRTACDPGLAHPGSQGLRWIGYGMSSHSGSFVTTSCPATPTADGSVKTISALRSSATPSPVVVERPVS
jgi:hypothetical protein